MQWGDQLVWEWWRGKVPNAPLHYLPSNIHMVHTLLMYPLLSTSVWYSGAELQCLVFCYSTFCSNMFTVRFTSILLISFLLV